MNSYLVHAQKPKFGDSRFFSEKTVLTAFRVGTIFAGFNFVSVSLALNLKLLSYLACGEKKKI